MKDRLGRNPFNKAVPKKDLEKPVKTAEIKAAVPVNRFGRAVVGLNAGAYLVSLGAVLVANHLVARVSNRS